MAFAGLNCDKKKWSLEKLTFSKTVRNYHHEFPSPRARRRTRWKWNVGSELDFTMLVTGAVPSWTNTRSERRNLSIDHNQSLWARQQSAKSSSCNAEVLQIFRQMWKKSIISSARETQAKLGLVKSPLKSHYTARFVKWCHFVFFRFLW